MAKRMPPIKVIDETLFNTIKSDKELEEFKSYIDLDETIKHKNELKHLMEVTSINELTFEDLIAIASIELEIFKRDSKYEKFVNDCKKLLNYNNINNYNLKLGETKTRFAENKLFTSPNFASSYDVHGDGELKDYKEELRKSLSGGKRKSKKYNKSKKSKKSKKYKKYKKYKKSKKSRNKRR